MISASFFIIISHSPLTLILVVIVQTLLVCLIIKVIFNRSWFSFLLFLVFVGGLIILFIYVVSLTPNKAFILQVPSSINTIILLILTIFILIILFNYQVYSYQIVSSVSAKTLKLFSSSSIWVTLTRITYLLLILLIVAEIIIINKRPLRALVNK
jgi:NADH-ubiquinone oxidoreductase chain 6